MNKNNNDILIHKESYEGLQKTSFVQSPAQSGVYVSYFKKKKKDKQGKRALVCLLLADGATR